MKKLFVLTGDWRQMGDIPQLTEDWSAVEMGSDSSNSIANAPSEGIWQADTVFPVYSLVARAKCTDYLHSGRQILLLSDRFVVLLQSFNIGRYQIFSANFNKKTCSQTYKHLVVNHYSNDLIDWEHTCFYDLNGASNQLITVKSDRELHTTGAAYGLRTLALKSEAEDFDLFRFSLSVRYPFLICPEYYISERLKIAIESAGLTGISFHEVAYLCYH